MLSNWRLVTKVTRSSGSGTELAMGYVRPCRIVLCGLVIIFILALEIVEEEDSEYDANSMREDVGLILDETQEKPDFASTDENWHEDYSDDDIYYDPVDHILRPMSKPAAYAAKHRLPILLWWTSFTTGNDIKRCGGGECYITEARKFQTHPRTNVFLFYGTSFSGRDVPLPRLAHHEWALFHEESPKNNPILHHQTTIELFNHTATFRRTSDYPLVTQFLESLQTLLKKPKYKIGEKSTDGLAAVVYIQSSCDTPSDRDTYVSELMKHIQVDSYGACLHNKDLPEQYKSPTTMDNEGFHNIIAKYKFTLSFENGICDDYITEKLWRPLTLGSVPIYKGSPTVEEWMPDNHSIILVDNFKNPQDLAEFILWLDRNDEEYAKYLEFKHTGVTNNKLLELMQGRPWGHTIEEPNFVTGFECFVCDRVHENLQREATGFPRKYHIASQEHYGCPKPVGYNNIASAVHDRTDIWTAEYESSREQSKELNQQVLQSQTS